MLGPSKVKGTVYQRWKPLNPFWNTMLIAAEQWGQDPRVLFPEVDKPLPWWLARLRVRLWAINQAHNPDKDGSQPS
jgi:hypothetical protein